MERTGTYPRGFISEKEEMLKELMESKKNKNLIGIWTGTLGSQMLACFVETIRGRKAEDDKVIIVRERNLEENNIATHVLYFREIVKLHRFKTMPY